MLFCQPIRYELGPKVCNREQQIVQYNMGMAVLHEDVYIATHAYSAPPTQHPPPTTPGETADTMGALRYAKACGALCVGITNTVGSAIDRETDTGIHINAGCEIGVASTKAYTSQIITLTLSALTLCEDSIAKRPYCNDLVNGLANLPAAVKQVLDLQEGIMQLASTLKDENSLLVFGRGRNYATAMEAALKVLVVCVRRYCCSYDSCDNHSTYTCTCTHMRTTITTPSCTPRSRRYHTCTVKALMLVK